MRVMVILNPSADLGHGLGKMEVVKREGEIRGGLDLVVTDSAGHAVDLARSAAAYGYDVVVAAGGDGTVHEVINGLVQNGQSTAKLGVIPIGSGNDFAYALGIPTTIPESLDVIFNSATLPVDLGAVEDDRGKFELFHNNLGVGFDANVVIRVEEITALHGFAKYFWGVLKTLVLDFRPIHLQMRFDDEQAEHDVLFVAFGIGPRHGGGFMLTPDALVDDNLIDTCAVWPIGRVRALSLLYAAIKGTHTRLSVVSMRQNREIAISSQRALPIHIDGEIFASPSDGVQNLQITSLPAAVKVATPKGKSS